ncbi:MFS transporter [Massilia sp. TS11]|uniref:MFS transporter n=1 Tax=Massilia sp. TS11 TaxID=2908003 RepID=UPI001EDC6831|nr:MFS transporter [Massilia sp. TS11]MCG2585161.1 MFS transporter [Massilia sp. TS11]
MQASRAISPWAWVPSLYFAQGLPYVAVMTLATVMYKNFGIDNADIALYTSWLYWPWVIKPLWAPVVDLLRTKRWWITVLQLVVGASFAAVAFTIQLPGYFQASLAVFWLMAFSSATHDIAADGFYMLGLEKHEQAAYVGVRSTFYRAAMITGQGALVYLAGRITEASGDPHLAWSAVFVVLALLFGLLGGYHLLRLPRPASDGPAAHGARPFAAFAATFASFFRKPGIGLILAFLLTFRLGEAQLIKMVGPFALDTLEKGGLGLSTKDFGIAYGSFGVLALTLGGLLGGWVISRLGLKRSLWLMVCAIHLPDLVFVYLAYAQPQSFALVTAAISLEQFGYGFGFTAYMLYMILVAEGEHKTAHFALCTGFMAMGMMLPGMVSGKIQEFLGYQHFFVWVCLATLPSFVLAALLRIDPEFGKKKEA